MATYNNWTYPTAYAITGNTKIKEADNNIQSGINDMEAWVNGTGLYVGVGLNDYIDADLAERFSSFTESTVVTEW
jgi:malate synthase